MAKRERLVIKRENGPFLGVDRTRMACYREFMGVEDGSCRCCGRN